jgi:hypothetical protein
MTNNDNIDKKPKSRIIPIYEFFEILQLEWICADLRYKIYKRPNDKSYWKKVCDGKKNTIENIAIKNNLPTIFNDEDLYQHLKGSIYKDTSLPNFMYKDNENKINQGHWDIYYYYYRGSDVRFDLFGESKVGNIKLFDTLNPTLVIVTIKGDTVEYSLPIEKVTRIL